MDNLAALGLTLGDVKRAMGLTSDNTEHDTFIEERMRMTGDLLIEDWFTSTEFEDLTPNQKRRAVEGIACLIAADCLLVIPVNSVMSSGTNGSTITIGPITVGGWNGSRSMADLRRVAYELKSRGESILQDLRLSGYGGILTWQAVGTTKRPTYVGGPRYGIRRSYGNY